MRNQFDYICKVAMEDERKDYLKALSRQYKREDACSVIWTITASTCFLPKTPIHPTSILLKWIRFTLRTENSLLAEASKIWMRKKRDVILRYYFLGFNNAEISKILEVNRSTTAEKKTRRVEFIKKFIEEEA